MGHWRHYSRWRWCWDDFPSDIRANFCGIDPYWNRCGIGNFVTHFEKLAVAFGRKPPFKFSALKPTE